MNEVFLPNHMLQLFAKMFPELTIADVEALLKENVNLRQTLFPEHEDKDPIPALEVPEFIEKLTFNRPRVIKMDFVGKLSCEGEVLETGYELDAFLLYPTRRSSGFLVEKEYRIKQMDSQEE